MHSFIRTGVLAFAGLSLAAGAAGSQAAPPKVAYVDLAVLMLNAPGRVEAESTYAREAAAYSAELQQLGRVLDSLLQDYRKAEPTLSQAERDGRQRSLAGKQLAAQQRQAELQRKLATGRDDAMAPLQEVVKKVLDDIRAEEGYAAIFTTQGVVVADKNLDITDRVVARLKTIAATQAKSRPPSGGA